MKEGRKRKYLKKTPDDELQKRPHTKAQKFKPNCDKLQCVIVCVCVKDEHNQTMARLRFILDVVDCVVNLARSKGAAYNPMVDSVSIRRGDSVPSSVIPHVSQSQQ